MIRKPSLELCLLLWRQYEFSLTLIIGETLPKSHSELYPVLGGQSKEGGEGIRQHV